MNDPSGYNYAQAYGIESAAGAVIFAILYILLLLLFIKQAFSRPTSVHVVMVLFSAFRIAAFVLRTHLARLDGGNLHMLIAFEILYNVGFFGLLYSAYTLVLDRGRLSDLPLPNGLISRFIRKPLFRLALITAILIDIAAAVKSARGSTQSEIDTGNTLRKVATYIFLALCILVVIETLFLIRAAAHHGTYKVVEGGFGATHSTCVLCIITILLLTREAFFAATANNLAKQNDENLWYPLSVLTEFVAAVMFVAPGLVPSRAELPT